MKIQEILNGMADRIKSVRKRVVGVEKQQGVLLAENLELKQKLQELERKLTIVDNRTKRLFADRDGFHGTTPYCPPMQMSLMERNDVS